MTGVKIFKREDGTKIKISIRVGFDFIRTYVTVTVEKCEPGKRKFYNVHDSDNYIYRRLESKEREEHIKETQLDYVTAEEVNEVFRDALEDVYTKVSWE